MSDISEIDCGQSGVCAMPPGCQRHWAERAAELARDRDEARRQRFEANVHGALYRALSGRWHRKFMEVVEDLAVTSQMACGFAWDTGREMARLERELDEAKYAAAEAQWAANR